MTFPLSSSTLPLPARNLRRLVRLLRLRLLLAICVRAAVVTALISAIGYRLVDTRRRQFPNSDGSREWDYGLGDVYYISWLVLSPALFFPCAAVIDLALCGIIANRIVAIDAAPYLLRWAHSEPPMICLVLLASFVEFLTVLCIGLLRSVGACLAMAETYYLARGSGSSLGSAAFNLFVRSQYDWWTLEPLPEDFTSRKWFRRIWRPWLQYVPRSQVSSQPHQRSITPLMSIFFGGKTFQPRRGERRWFVLLRGLAAVGSLASIIAYSTSVLFLQPIIEHRGPPIQVQRLSSLPSEDKMSSPTWGVILGINTRNVQLAPGVVFSDLLSVTPEVPSGSTVTPQCSSTLFTSTMEILSTFQLVSYQCATSWVEDGQTYTPEIRISIDYAALNISRSRFSPEGSIKIWPSFITNVAQVLESTQPVSLVMGNTLIASVTSTLRSSFIDPTRASFGFDSDQKTYMVGQLTVLGTDPLAPPAPGGTAATMRVFKELPSTDWELYSDTRQQFVLTLTPFATYFAEYPISSTVLAGLSALGGLSVFFNSVFVILFGGSMVLVLFDAKPLSIFGWFHYFSRATLSIRLAADFPQLQDEGGQPGHRDSGLVAFIREYMLDLAILPAEPSCAPVCDTVVADPPVALAPETQACGSGTKETRMPTPGFSGLLESSIMPQFRLRWSNLLMFVRGLR